MTLDKAIMHCHAVAHGDLCGGTVNATACEEEHEQLATWLEELRARRSVLSLHAKYIEIYHGINADGEPYTVARCGNCGRHFNYEEKDRADVHYCWHCGAIMEGIYNAF